jgi:hypothetical protein
MTQRLNQPLIYFIYLLGLCEVLTEISTRNISWCKARPALKADNLAAAFEPIVYNIGPSHSRYIIGIYGLFYVAPAICVCYVCHNFFPPYILCKFMLLQ